MKDKQLVEKLNKHSIVLHILASLIGYFLIEVICRHSFKETYTYMTARSLVFLYNAFLIFVTTLIVYLFKRRVFYRLLLLVLWLGLGIVNGVVLLYRVTPFTGPDLQLVTDALKLITIYMSILQIVLVASGVVLVVILLVILWRKAPIYQQKINYIRNMPVFLMMCLSLWGLTDVALDNRVLSNYFGNIAFAYQDYGYPYCLVTTIFNTGMNAPHNYSDESISNLIAAEPVTAMAAREEQTLPNIIFLQLESFFDPSLVEFLELSEDPIPNFRQLSDAYSSGYFRVPSVGAGTANTEFEVITGMSLRYFGPGEYPYKTILKKTTCESMSYDLKELGYTAHAIHNNEADFYDRNYVFSQLGFDTFTAEEYMNITEYTPTGWAKDSILTSQIMAALESTEKQDYIYTISVQGHGEYPTDYAIEDPSISVSGFEDESKKNQWEYYINQVYEMDQFIGELVETLSEFDEDVVLVMYGDHLPTLGLEVSDVKNRYLFQTEYVIWDNMGLSEKDQNISSYQIGAEVLNQLDIHVGTIFTYHQNRRNSKNYQVNLEELQYDILYGNQYAYGQENPFEATEIQMGLEEIKVNNVKNVTDDRIYIYGSNFTVSSQVRINGKQQNTVFVSSKLLIVNDNTVKEDDVIVVDQVSNSTGAVILSQTEEYIYAR